MSQRCEYCKTVVGEGLAWKMHLCGKAHQKMIMRQEFTKETVNRSVYAPGLPQNVSQEELYDYFSKFGSIISINFHFKNSRFCFVEFADIKVADKVASTKHYLNKRFLPVSRRRYCSAPGRDDDENVSLNNEEVMGKLQNVSNLEEQATVMIKELTLTEREIEERRNLALMISQSLKPEFPHCLVSPFGSSVSSLGFHDCDLDVFADLGIDDWRNVNLNDGKQELSQEDRVEIASRLFRKNKHFSRVFKLPKARIPLVRFRYRPYALSCDVSFRNPMSVRNTQLIYYYTLMDPRVRQLMIVVRYWAKQQELTGQSSKTKLNNYALMMLLIFALQTMDPPVILTVEELQQLHVVQGKERCILSGWDCTLCEDIQVFQNTTRNTMPLQRLLQEFFEICSKFDFKKLVMCPFWGKPVPKSDFSDAELLPDNFKYYKENLAKGNCEKFQADLMMCLQDPFELCFNLTRATFDLGVELFQRRCSMAAEICKSSPESEILPKLFIPVQDEKVSEKKDSQSTDLCTFTLPLEGNFGSEAALKAVQKVMETGLKFECSIVQQNDDSEGTPAKKPKDHVYYLQCKAFWQTWMLRKQIAKEFDFPKSMLSLERESLITNYIVDVTFKKERPPEPIVDFLCEVSDAENEIKIKLSDISSQKKNFGAIVPFLHRFVPLLIKKSRDEGDI